MNKTQTESVRIEKAVLDLARKVADKKRMTLSGFISVEIGKAVNRHLVLEAAKRNPKPDVSN